MPKQKNVPKIEYVSVIDEPEIIKNVFDYIFRLILEDEDTH